MLRIIVFPGRRMRVSAEKVDVSCILATRILLVFGFLEGYFVLDEPQTTKPK